jgi:hypothetical protein
MAAKKTLEAAVDYFAARSHDAWRRQFHKANPKERALPRMRMRGGKMVDINKPWKDLDPKAKAENRVAAYAAYAAIEKFPNDREKASDYVHKQWIKRNRADPNQPKTLFKPYSALSEVEKDKDRAHIDRMKAALAAVRKKQAPKQATRRALYLDQRAAARLQAAATRLSAALGATVTAEALMAAGVEAVLAVCEAAAPRLRRGGARAKKRR